MNHSKGKLLQVVDVFFSYWTRVMSSFASILEGKTLYTFPSHLDMAQNHGTSLELQIGTMFTTGVAIWGANKN